LYSFIAAIIIMLLWREKRRGSEKNGSKLFRMEKSIKHEKCMNNVHGMAALSENIEVDFRNVQKHNRSEI
jgi:hypothetical protein